jgi:Flp pilus assembly protein TadG
MRCRRERQNEEGAILVHVAFAILALTAFTTFVVDYGVFWESRRQAQNSADAAALAGAIALIQDDPNDFTPTGIAAQTAVSVAQSNLVWGAPPSVVPATDVQILSGTGVCPPPNVNGTCIRVDVHRSQARGNPIPMFFGTLVGLTQQDVRATATAQIIIGNRTECLKPWAVIDKWAENYPGGPWTVASTFDKYYTRGPNAGTPDPAISPADNYIAPTPTSTGTGFHPYNPDGSYSADYGLQLRLKVGDKTDFDFASGWFSALALTDSQGGNDYANNIKGCIGISYQIGDELPVATEPGQMVGPTSQAVETDSDSLINQDPKAYWDPTLNNGRGGVAGSAYATSPRIVAIPLVNPDMMVQANNNGRTTVPIANIAGFFVEGYDTSSKSVVGRLVTMPGLMATGASPIGGPSAFLQTVVLVR